MFLLIKYPFCVLQLTGVLDDCFCDIESIDVFNNFRIYPHIRKLTERDFFRYYKVNLCCSPQRLYVNWKQDDCAQKEMNDCIFTQSYGLMNEYEGLVFVVMVVETWHDVRAAYWRVQTNISNRDLNTRIWNGQSVTDEDSCT